MQGLSKISIRPLRSLIALSSRLGHQRRITSCPFKWPSCLNNLNTIDVHLSSKRLRPIDTIMYPYSGINRSSFPSIHLQRTTFSTKKPILSQSTVVFPPCDSINLTSLIPNSILQVIRTLPEVEEAIAFMQGKNVNNNIQSILVGLDRAIEIFRHVGKLEYKSILFFKATFLSQLCRYNDTINLLSLVVSMDQEDSESCVERNNFHINSSLAKMHWYNGTFDKSLDYATVMNNNISSSMESTLYRCCAMNASALSQLLLLQKIVDVDILRLKFQSTSTSHIFQQQKNSVNSIDDVLDSLKTASNMLENKYRTLKDSPQESLSLKTQYALACASSFNNQGVVELLRDIVDNERLASNCHSSYDSAIATWQVGLSILHDLEQLQQHSVSTDAFHTYICKTMRARICCNISWSILFHSDYIADNHQIQSLTERQLKIASKYASSALNLCNEISTMANDSTLLDNEAINLMMGRALGLVSSCYAKAGSVVTAEGLLKSASDLYKNMQVQKNNPMSQIDNRSLSLYYSSLCAKWDKRESDSKTQSNIALEINDKILSEKWRDVSSIYSGLCYFTVTDYL